MSGLALQRAAVLIVAVLAVAWLGVRYEDGRKIEGVKDALADKGAGSARLEGALADARGAGKLDPGSGAEELSYVAAAQIRLRQPQAAVATLDELVRREPDSAEAWFLIAQLTQTSDPARSAQARAELNRLDPGVPRRR